MTSSWSARAAPGPMRRRRRSRPAHGCWWFPRTPSAPPTQKSPAVSPRYVNRAPMMTPKNCYRRTSRWPARTCRCSRSPMPLPVTAIQPTTATAPKACAPPSISSAIHHAHYRCHLADIPSAARSATGMPVSPSATPTGTSSSREVMAATASTIWKTPGSLIW